MKNKAVFLDRDGTIMEDAGYLDNLDNIVFIKGVFDALKILRRLGYKLVVVTNQSGVARGFFPEEFVQTTHQHIGQRMKQEGVKIDAFYYCPHLPDGKVPQYAIECDCRKPKAGMLKKAEKDLDLDLSASYIIGDHYADIGLGKNGGLKAVLVLTGHGRQEWQKRDAWEHRPDYVAQDIRDAARWIEQDRKSVKS